MLQNKLPSTILLLTMNMQRQSAMAITIKKI